MEVQERRVGYAAYPIADQIGQSSPIDLGKPYNAGWISGKTILITGGASGFGAGFVKKFAAHGANVVFGDIDTVGAERVARETSLQTGNQRVWWYYCDVTDWKSQVNLFKEAVKVSPHGGIDVVVANAGIAGADKYEVPEGLDGDDPPKPDIRTIDVNLTGVLYTTHLALFYLPRNPGSASCSPSSDPAKSNRDRHLLLIGSMASLGPLPAQALYTCAKHAVLGLYRSIRTTSWIHGVRVNLLCPYFIDTAILPGAARALLAGGGLGKAEDVIEAATRLTADCRIMGRSLYIGPKMKVMLDQDNEYQITLVNEGGNAKAIWEPFAHDHEDSEIFTRNMTRLLNQFTRIRGWKGYFFDLWRAILFAVRARPRILPGARGK